MIHSLEIAQNDHKDTSINFWGILLAQRTNLGFP